MPLTVDLSLMYHILCQSGSLNLWGTEVLGLEPVQAVAKEAFQ
jgi:hypothetical protein